MRFAAPSAPWLPGRPHCAAPAGTCLQTLSKAGYLYDSTLIERYAAWSPTSPSADAPLWPYTMDGGIPQVGFRGKGGAGPGCMGADQ